MSAFSYSWNEEGGVQRFMLQFERCRRSPRTWKEEICAAASTVASRTTKPVIVCMSGGYDSEVAGRAFREMGIPFSVLTLEHEEGTNADDIGYAVRWCKKEGVAHDIVRMSVRAFLTKEVDRYAERYPAVHPFRYLQLKLMELVEERGGFAVLSSGEQIYLADTTKERLERDDIYIQLSSGTALPLEWCRERGSLHEPYFHFATPEVCLSYLRDPLISFALDHPDPLFRHGTNTYTLKRLMYQSHWHDLEPRGVTHGFERVKDVYEEAKRRLRARHADAFALVNMPVTAFEQQLAPAV